MERLKKILRTALAEQAISISLVSGREPELVTAAGVATLPGEPKLTDDYLQNLKSYLFNSVQTSNPAAGLLGSSLQIANVGRIQLIARTKGAQAIHLYLPPAGQGAFDRDWQQYSKPEPDSAEISFGSLETSDLNPFLQPTEPDLGDSGFIPAGLMGSQPSVAPVTAKAAVALSSQASVAKSNVQQTQQPQFTIQQAQQAQQIQHVVGHSAAVAVQSNNLLRMQAEEHTGTGSHPHATGSGLHSQVTGSRSVVKEPQSIELSYGPLMIGDAGISDGRNRIDQVLAELVKRKGSDLHMTCGEPLCFRIDGEITRITLTPSSPADVEAYLAPIIPKRNLAELASSNDTDFAYEIRNVGRFRVNVFRDKNGIGSVMRHIPSQILTAEQLNLPPAITKFCGLTKGLVLVTGPTGSGKSTTLAAMIDLINKKRPDHILTIEDPIEFVHPQQKALVNQREVHRHTASFSRALKAALREDPDIVLIGEMRDLETVAIAIETAETGHLVFGTLHTNTAVSTIDRIIDQFPTDRQQQIRMMLSSSLKGVVAQTLLRKKSGGRVAAHEILVTSDAVCAMIREGKNHMIANHMQTQKQDGNILLNESLFKLVREGTVDAEDALRKAVDKNGLADMMRRAGINVGSPAIATNAGTPPTPPPRPPGTPSR